MYRTRYNQVLGRIVEGWSDRPQVIVLESPRYGALEGIQRREVAGMDEPIDIDALQTLVQQHRAHLGLSLRAAAEQADVPFNTLARVEKGHLPTSLTSPGSSTGWDYRLSVSSNRRGFARRARRTSSPITCRVTPT